MLKIIDLKKYGSCENRSVGVVVSDINIGAGGLGVLALSRSVSPATRHRWDVSSDFEAVLPRR